MSAKLTLDTDVKKLTKEDLEHLRSLCWDKDAEISKEISRRASLPFIWESELASVRMIRTAMKNEPKPFDEWKKPTSIVDAYIIGDTVTYKGKRYLAQGQGALMYAPDETDPVQGFCWAPYEEDGAVNAEDNPDGTPGGVELAPEAELRTTGSR